MTISALIARLKEHLRALITVLNTAVIIAGIFSAKPSIKPINSQNTQHFEVFFFFVHTHRALLLCHSL